MKVISVTESFKRWGMTMEEVCSKLKQLTQALSAIKLQGRRYNKWLKRRNWKR